MRKTTLKTVSVIALLLSALLFSAFSTEEPKPGAKPLAGIWEMQINNRPTGILKILGAGGDLSNVRLTPLGFVKTLWGSYEIQSDSTYIEKVEEHENTALNKKSVVLKYKMDNPNMLKISYTINDFHGEETYKRVPFTIVVN